MDEGRCNGARERKRGYGVRHCRRISTVKQLAHVRLTIRIGPMPSFHLDLFHYSVQQIIQELVSVLMHLAPKQLIELPELLDESARGDHAFLRRVLGYMDE